MTSEIVKFISKTQNIYLNLLRRFEGYSFNSDIKNNLEKLSDLREKIILKQAPQIDYDECKKQLEAVLNIPIIEQYYKQNPDLLNYVETNRKKFFQDISNIDYVPFIINQNSYKKIYAEYISKLKYYEEHLCQLKSTEKPQEIFQLYVLFLKVRYHLCVTPSLILVDQGKYNSEEFQIDFKQLKQKSKELYIKLITLIENSENLYNGKNQDFSHINQDMWQFFKEYFSNYENYDLDLEDNIDFLNLPKNKLNFFGNLIQPKLLDEFENKTKKFFNLDKIIKNPFTKKQKDPKPQAKLHLTYNISIILLSCAGTYASYDYSMMLAMSCSLIAIYKTCCIISKIRNNYFPNTEMNPDNYETIKGDISVHMELNRT